VFLDNPSYRAAENLPIFNERVSVKELEIMENGLSFKAANDHWQKTGFYYDHRENRKKLAGYLSRLNANFPSKALDLFCYLGAWGMTLAKAGVPNVDFIDQGNFEEDLKRNWELNALSGKLRFQRKDVFKALKELNLEDAKYDLIVSDPPAFCKSPKGLKKASEGYLRLHRACFKLLSDKSFFAACSCTKYMDMEAFIQNVNLAAQQERKKVTMLDIGSQGFDHPCAGFKDKSNYLKYTLFYVENL
ncbi:MAG: class I SAM-dependent methyltransferase, partial [Bacteriovoracaceae bacterium]